MNRNISITNSKPSFNIKFTKNILFPVAIEANGIVGFVGSVICIVGLFALMMHVQDWIIYDIWGVHIPYWIFFFLTILTGRWWGMVCIIGFLLWVGTFLGYVPPLIHH